MGQWAASDGFFPIDARIFGEYVLDMSPKKPQQTPLYVKLPSNAVAKLDRASQALGVPKKELIAGLVTRYVDPDSTQGLSALGTLSSRDPFPPPDGGTMLGSYSFQTYDPPEIMNANQAGQFLQISEAEVLELAEHGKLPGKKLGSKWRFSRSALVAWLSSPDANP
jgi:excisionase family DNA binding protein